MELYIVRHGRTHENENRIVQGQKYGTLNQQGREQANRLAERFKNTPLDAIYTSDLSRAHETAQAIHALHPDIPLIQTRQLREKSSGSYEGGPSQMRNDALEESGQGYMKWKPPGGESGDELLLRARHAFETIAQQHYGQTIIAVTHGQLIRLLLHDLQEGYPSSLDDLFKYEPDNTAVAKIDVTPLGHILHYHNCTTHL